MVGQFSQTSRGAWLDELDGRGHHSLPPTLGAPDRSLVPGRGGFDHTAWLKPFPGA
jgi:hypothetical protein